MIINRYLKFYILNELRHCVLCIFRLWSLFCSTRVYKSAFSTYSFGKLVFLFFLHFLCFLPVLCQILYNIHKLYNIRIINFYIVGVRYSMFLFSQSAIRHLQDVLKMSYQDKEDILPRHLADVQKVS